MNTIIGTHCIVEMHDCPPDLLNDPGYIKQALAKAAEQSESTLLEHVSHQFHPQGVTALALLAESHISLHTWPEDGYAAADLFTCGTHTQPEKGCQSLIEAFRPERHVMVRLSRGSLEPRLETVEQYSPEGNHLGVNPQESEGDASCREPNCVPISG